MTTEGVRILIGAEIGTVDHAKTTTTTSTRTLKARQKDKKRKKAKSMVTHDVVLRTNLHIDWGGQSPYYCNPERRSAHSMQVHTCISFSFNVPDRQDLLFCREACHGSMVSHFRHASRRHGSTSFVWTSIWISLHASIPDLRAIRSKQHDWAPPTGKMSQIF